MRRHLLSPILQISVKLTARGWQVMFFGVISLFSALLIGTTQLYQFAYALAGLLLVALVLGLFLSRGLGYTRRTLVGERFIAGRPSQVESVVRNASRTRSSSMGVVDHLPKWRLVEMSSIEGPGARTIQQAVLFARRGLYELGPAEIQTTDPFGLLRFVRRFEARTEVLVYPEVFELRGFPVWGLSRETGPRNSAAQRRGDEFSGLREYRWGDDRRHIHWKSVARTGELIVKEFSHNTPRRHVVILDLHRAGNHAPEVEDAVSVAGSVLLYLLQEALPFRLLCTDKGRSVTAFGDDEAAYWTAMDLLAMVRADGDTKLEDLLNERLREERQELGESVILISRALGNGLIDSVRRLRTAGLSVVVVALAAHTYWPRDASSSGYEAALAGAAFSENVPQLEQAGADVHVVRRPGGVAAFAGGRGVSGTRAAV
jgi:uncharacterized protein (DUF58 family)